MSFMKGGAELLDGFRELYLDLYAVCLRAGEFRLKWDFHRTGRAFAKRTKRGLTSLAIPGNDPPFITILTNVSVNTGPDCIWISILRPSTTQGVNPCASGPLDDIYH